MFRNILLPVDLTDKHEMALSTAVELARQARGQVTLLHVIEVISGLPIEEEKGFYGRLEDSARQHLKPLAALLAQQQIPHRIEIIIGPRARQVVRFASDNHSDVIILTAPRFQPEQPMSGWSSLSYKVSFFCSCPVLLVK